jgi:hypothetical protein
MTPPTLEQLIRRLVGNAFDAGAQSRAFLDRSKARQDHQDYAVAVLKGHVDAEVARQAAQVGAA